LSEEESAVEEGSTRVVVGAAEVEGAANLDLFAGTTRKTKQVTQHLAAGHEE